MLLEVKAAGARKSNRIAVGPLAALAIFAGLCLQPLSASARDLFEENAYSGYKANLDNGKYLFSASGCGACHGAGDNTELLSGGLEMETAIGKFFAPNISAHPNGIGGWSNATFLNAVMNGIDKNGDNLYPVMPYTSYGGMKPEDVLDIKAYIDTLPQSDAASKEHEIAFPFSRQTTITLWKRSHFTVSAFQQKEETQMERGRYLVENIGACGDCHTPRTTTYGLDLDRAYEGEKGLTGAVAPDITKARMASLASAEVFTRDLIDDGKKLNGSPIADPVMHRLAAGMKVLTENDRNAMYAFLSDREVKSTPVATSAQAVCTEKNASAALGGDNAALATAADGFIGKYCRNCHGPGESSQGSYPAGDLASIAANAAFVTPGNAEKSRLFTSVTSGRMPLGKRPTEEEVKALGDWINSLSEKDAPTIEANTPQRTRPVLKYGDFVEIALKDITRVDERDRPFQRYFSYRNQYNGMMGCETDATFLKRMPVLAGGFKKLLNSLSYEPKLALPKEVDGSNGLLVRVDLRDLGWTAEDYNFLINEYFYGTDPESDPSLSVLSKSTSTTLPIMRVDWFMSNAARPKIYNHLMRLPTQIKELEKRFNVDVDKNIRNLNVIRAGFADGSSGVSDHNRMLERHELPFGGYYWKSYDFAGDVGKQVLKRFPHGPKEIAPLEAGLESFEHDGGEMIFALPNGLQGYYLSTADGKQIDVGPTSIVSFRKRPIGKGVEITNARSCFDCHANGILSKRDQLREHIQVSTLFDRKQRDVLLKMYVSQEELDAAYNKDRQRFVQALNALEVTEPTPDGSAQSMQAPGNTELVTYFADQYENELDFDAIAAEFDMTPKEFEAAARQINDPALLRLVIDWVATLEAGGTIPRAEFEQQYAFLLDPLMELKPLAKAAVVVADANANANAAATGDAAATANNAAATNNAAAATATTTGDAAAASNTAAATGDAAATANTAAAATTTTTGDAAAANNTAAATGDAAATNTAAATNNAAATTTGDAAAANNTAAATTGDAVANTAAATATTGDATATGNTAAATTTTGDAAAAGNTAAATTATADATAVGNTGVATTTTTANTVAAATPEYRQDEKAQESKVKLALLVPSTTAKVGDRLSFELTTNQACELQVLYVEETGNVEFIPDVMIGNTTLNVGEKRLIPQPDTGNLTFDTPAAAETMVAFCRIGGLGDQRMTPEKAKKLIAESRQPATRGLAINLAQQARDDNGASGLQMVTFEIKGN